jgi:hypothetical protein
VRGRLEQSALVLDTERAFDQTTVAEIAERASLTSGHRPLAPAQRQALALH